MLYFPFKAANSFISGAFQYYLRFYVVLFTHFVLKLEKCRKEAFVGEYAYIMSILHRWGFSQFITISNLVGGVFRDPKFLLHNKWTAPC